jgi:multidrug efflux pump subunit AcrA (membrane-fusion protein)
MSDAADPASRTYEARYVLGGEAAQAPLGATVTVSMATRGTGDASEVPLGALYDDGKSSGVWVLDAATSTVSFRIIEIYRLAEETAVVSGVRPGERIVALGAHLLHEGAQVRASGRLMALQ